MQFTEESEDVCSYAYQAQQRAIDSIEMVNKMGWVVAREEIVVSLDTIKDE